MNTDTFTPIAPTLCILGHVDVGKTKLLDYMRNTKTHECATGITQQIGTTYFSRELLEELCDDQMQSKLTVPGIVMIDTPGHECFTTMRYTGALVSDMVIVLIDINKGIEKETIACLDFVTKQFGTNYVIALNKIDRIYGWKPLKNASLRKCYAKNTKNQNEIIRQNINTIVCQLAELEINACAYYENINPKEFVSLVPISASTGEGLPDLFLLISKMTERYTKKIMADTLMTHSFGYILDERIEQNIGNFFISIHNNGTIANKNKLIILNRTQPSTVIHATVKMILTSGEGKEMKDKSRYSPCSTITGTHGIGLVLSDITHPIETGAIYGIIDDDEKVIVAELKKKIRTVDIEEDKLNANYVLKEKGVTVCASSTHLIQGFMKECLSTTLTSEITKRIDIASIHMGKITKELLIKTGGTILRSSGTSQNEEYKRDFNKRFNVILYYDPVYSHSNQKNIIDTLDQELVTLAQQSGIHILTSNTTYNLVRQYDEWINGLDRVFFRKYSNLGPDINAEILPQHVFMKTTPLLFGVKINKGTIKIGMKIHAVNADNNSVVLGTIIGMQKDNKVITMATVGQEVCIKIMNEQKVVYGEGKDFDASYTCHRYMTQEEHRIWNYINQ